MSWVSSKEAESKKKTGVTEASLLLQQESLKKIWDNPEEDIYELEEQEGKAV